METFADSHSLYCRTSTKRTFRGREEPHHDGRDEEDDRRKFVRAPSFKVVDGTLYQKRDDGHYDDRTYVSTTHNGSTSRAEFVDRTYRDYARDIRPAQRDDRLRAGAVHGSTSRSSSRAAVRANDPNYEAARAEEKARAHDQWNMLRERVAEARHLSQTPEGVASSRWRDVHDFISNSHRPKAGEKVGYPASPTRGTAAGTNRERYREEEHGSPARREIYSPTAGDSSHYRVHGRSRSRDVQHVVDDGYHSGDNNDNKHTDRRRYEKRIYAEQHPADDGYQSGGPNEGDYRDARRYESPMREAGYSRDRRSVSGTPKRADASPNKLASEQGQSRRHYPPIVRREHRGADGSPRRTVISDRDYRGEDTRDLGHADEFRSVHEHGGRTGGYQDEQRR